ncbi:hypothetical protein ACIGHF_11130 [Stenotrophomonas sp. NPDC077464]|uniref:hypothetical protein n=1 Tax=unclassified Stenotrophomonas TaxID=196198 RepID=UPI0037CF4200
MNRGDMSKDKFFDRSQARAGGAITGVAIVAIGRAAVAVVPALVKLAVAKVRAPPKLTNGQKSSLARFEKKFSRDNRNVEVSLQKNGTANFKNDVPGRVPGSKAVYENSVDPSGRTLSAQKTTLDPAGKVIHIKDKM